MADEEDEIPVRAFVSYSWSSPAHDAWVVRLASRLREDGVDAILDKWDLKPGHDANVFMEQMVTDPTVTKVIMICDQSYVEKANHRKGGVGAESQIISPELYGKGAQDKFSALITELDEDGKAIIPVFYKGRIYFDFSDPSNEEAEYEELLRWILGKPSRVKPAIGKVPKHIAEGGASLPQTSSRYRRAEEAIRQGSNTAPGLVRDFGDALLVELEEGRLAAENRTDDDVISSIDKAQPVIDQLLQLSGTIARFDGSERLFEELFLIFEGMGRLMFRPPNVQSWRDTDFDNFRFLAHEAFVGVLALLIKEDRLDIAEKMLSRIYVVKHAESVGSGIQNFTAFYQHVRSLEFRNERLKLRRLSLHADMLSSIFEKKDHLLTTLCKRILFYI